MNKKTQGKIEKLKNSMVCNREIMKTHPELKEELEEKNRITNQEIADLESPPVKAQKKISEKGEIEVGRDLGWNCLAVQKNGEQCKCFRKHGNYCKRHLIHHVEELEEKLKEGALVVTANYAYKNKMNERVFAEVGSLFGIKIMEILGTKQ